MAPLLAVVLAAAMFAALPPNARAAESRDPALVSVPMLDLPDQEGAYAVPTWDQSIELTKAQYQISHRVLARWAERELGVGSRDYAAIAIGLGWEALAGVLPLGTAWAHEEGHRAILDRHGFRSFNGVYDFDPRSGAIYVRRVRDEDLVRLKAEHPADSVRLAAAGMETQTLLSLRLERDVFFLKGRAATDWATIVSNAVGNAGYVWACSDAAFDRFTDETNKADGGVVGRRDALGLDCTAWAYDLQRPDEPYEARGIHPSGIGIDRYVKFSDLSRSEQKLMRTVRWLVLADLVDPYVFFHEGWDLGGDRRGTTNLGFFLTSFGWSIDHNVFLALGAKNVLVTMHHGANGTRWLPGIDATLWRLPIADRGFVSLGAGAWLQPEDQRWDAVRASPGARLHATASIPVWSALELEVGAAHKTEGWVAGVANLGSETSLRAGLAWRFGIPSRP